jgi:hypothetical protein
LFPGGNAFYVDVAEQPDRRDLLAELLGANVHPKVSPEVAKASIAIISAESMNLRAAVEAARPPRAKIQLLERVLLAVTRSAAIELAQLERLLKANGLEADIHTMIPDRSSAPGKKRLRPRRPRPQRPPEARRLRTRAAADGLISLERRDPRLPST